MKKINYPYLSNSVCFLIYQISKYVIETVKTNNIYEGIADIYYGSINNGAEVEDYIEGIRR